MGQSATLPQGFVLDKSATDQFPTSGGLTVVPKGGVPQSMTDPPPMGSCSQLTAQRDPDGLVPKHCGVTAFSGHNDFCDDNLSVYMSATVSASSFVEAGFEPDFEEEACNAKALGWCA